MATEASKFKLGLFVVFGLAIAIAGIVVLGAHRYFQNTERFVTFFDESVQGLEEGSAVKLRGVPVGRVSRVYVSASQDLVAVEVEIFPHAFLDSQGKPMRTLMGHQRLDKMIEEGLRVRLTFAGITGLKYLELDWLDPEQYPLEDLGFPTPSNWLPSAPSTLKGLEADFTVAARKLAQVDYEGISNDIKKALVRINKFLEAVDYETTGKRVREVFEDTRSAVADVRKAAGRIQEVLDKKAIDAMLKDGQEMIQDARDLVKQVKAGTHTTTAEMEKAFKSLDETSRKAAAVVDKIDRELSEAGVAKVVLSARQAFDKGAAAAESVAELRTEAQRAIRELNATLRTLRRFIDYMERNPDALLSGKREPAP